MCSIFQITCDGALFNRCLDCFLGKAAYIRNLQDNLVALDTELGNLIAIKNDLMRRVDDDERKQMIRLERVQRWISMVDAVKTEADQFIGDRSQEIEKLCVGGYCSKNCRSSYKFEKEKEKRNFLVRAGAGLKEAPDVKGLGNVRRLSLMQNQIETLSEVPTCPHLLTLFLDFNEKLEMIADGFFQFMPSLKVLRISYCGQLEGFQLPFGMSELGSSLELLDISHTYIQELPEELKLLVNLKCLNLRWTAQLNKIPRQLISNSSRLRVLRMFATGWFNFHEASEESVLFGGGEVLVQELLGLKYLEVLELTLGSYRALQILLSSNKLKSCIRSLQLRLVRDTASIIDAAAFADLKHLNELYIFRGFELEELKIDYAEIVRKKRKPFVFRSLQRVTIVECHKLKDVTFLVFAPNLKSLRLDECSAMEEIISVGKIAETPEMVGHISPFENLQMLDLLGLPHLKSIFWKPLPFTHLKEISVRYCPNLEKIPLDSNSAKERKFVIRGEEDWWNRLQWEDEATQIAFRSCFKHWQRILRHQFERIY